MTARIKGLFSFFLRLSLSAGLMWILFSGMKDKDKLVELIVAADFKYILYAFITFAVIHYLLLVRWRIFISAFNLDIPLINLARYFFLGLFGNLFLPSAIGGDIIKTVGLCVNTDNKPRIVASVLLDRISGFVAVVIVAAVGMLIGFSYLNNLLILSMVILMAAALAALGAVLFNEKLYSFFCQVFFFFPKLRDAVMQMHYDIMLLKDQKKAIVKAVAVACFGQMLLALTFFWLAVALHQHISLFYFIIFTPITCVASSFPSIGGLGFREGMLEYLLVGLGVISGIGVSVGLLGFLFMVIVGLFGWGFFIVTRDREHAVCVPASNNA